MWYLRGSAQIGSDEEGTSSEEEEEEEDLSGSLGYLNEVEHITDEEFSRLLGHLFVQQGKKRSPPQDMVDRGIQPANNKRHQRTALSPVKNEESEGSPSKKETPNLANPSQCVEELRSLSPLSDSFLHMLQRVIKTLPLEFIDEGGSPVLVKRILQDNTASKTRDLLISCFRSTSKGLEHLLSVRAPRYRQKGGSDKNSDKALFESCESLLSAFEPLTKDLDQFLLDSFYDVLFPESCSLEIPNPISEVNEQALTKKKVGQLLKKGCSEDLRWKLEIFLFMFQCQGIFQVVSQTIPSKHSSIQTLLDFGLFLSSKLRDVESTNKKLPSPLDEVKDTGLLEISTSTSLALLQAIVVLATRKVESCKSQLGLKKRNANEEKFFKFMGGFVDESEKAIEGFQKELERLRYIVQKRTKAWREDPSGVGIEGSGEEKKEFLHPNTGD